MLTRLYRVFGCSEYYSLPCANLKHVVMKRSRPTETTQQNIDYLTTSESVNVRTKAKLDADCYKGLERKMLGGRESLDGIIDTAIAEVRNNAAFVLASEDSNRECRSLSLVSAIHIPKDMYASCYTSTNFFECEQRSKSHIFTTSYNTLEDKFSPSPVSTQPSYATSSEKDSIGKVEAEIDEILSPVSDCTLGSSSTSSPVVQSVPKLLNVPFCIPSEDKKYQEITSMSSVEGKGQAMQEILRALATPSSQHRSHGRGRRGVSSSPTQCHLCGRTYTESSNLSKHIRTVHLKLRPFRCDRCASSFAEKNKLRKHIQSVHERARPYKCELCNATFSQASDRKRHRLVLHEGCRPFTCEQCGKAFGRRSSLTQHCNRVHKCIKMQITGKRSTVT